MALYECVLIARQDIASTQVEGLVEQLSTILTDNQGSVAKHEYWGLRNLAYRIKKNRKGHYVLLNIDAPSDAIHEMERVMRLNDDVLRYLTTRVDELEEGPSVVMQNRHSRDERGGRGGRRHEGGRDGGRDNRPPRSHDSAPKPAAAASAEGESA
ncbi:30S ribosomal protein S6 [Pelagibius sp. Alg239-R121]|uniref:30S ribosomal protein S6 n=1 Tax=Pelagibius sp. Alg239-R121 TaxID=2993448 RepID=UPI0024A7620C|nr:30S ribosomal protein S6 [Pelagibius sp. Alg239-R121]